MDFAKNYVRGSRARLDFLTKNIPIVAHFSVFFNNFLKVMFLIETVFNLEQNLESIYQKCLNRSVPDSIICVGIGWRQISAFQPLGRDCTRLRDRRMSWIVSKGRAAFFLSYIEHLSNNTYSQNSTKFVP